MSIDITNQEAIRKITWEDLVADAVERKDKDALRYKSTQTVSRKRADGTTYEDCNRPCRISSQVFGLRAYRQRPRNAPKEKRSAPQCLRKLSSF